MRTVSRLLRLCLCGGLSLLLWAGCVNPRSRARERPAALRQLSPTDKTLALGGNLREGFGKDAVFIAWGRPTTRKSYACADNRMTCGATPIPSAV